MTEAIRCSGQGARAQAFPALSSVVRTDFSRLALSGPARMPDEMRVPVLRISALSPGALSLACRSQVRGTGLTFRVLPKPTTLALSHPGGGRGASVPDGSGATVRGERRC
jgi:hypothetical protein